MNILITGGSVGLGNAVVDELSKCLDNKIYFTFNNHSEEANKIANEKENVVAIKCDFTNTEDIDKLERIIEKLELDILINNAYVGSPQNTHFHKTSSKIFLESFENNILPTIRITQCAISTFRKKKNGKIINILSAYLVNLPPIGFSIYCANKAYLLQLSKSWNSEYSRYNITSNCISPDFMKTNFSSFVDERIIEQMQKDHPLKNLLTPEEVAESVVYLVNATSQINGINLLINAAKNII